MIKLLDNSLVKNTGIYTVSNILNTAIPFLMLPLLTRYLTPEDYGTVSMFSLLVAFTSPFIGANVNGAIARQYYNQENVNMWSFVGNCMVILIASTCSVGLIFMIFGDLISQLSGFPKHMLWAVLMFSFSQFVNSILLNLLQVQKKAISYGVFNTVLTMVNVGLSIFFVVTLKLNWQGRIFGQVSAVVLFSLIAVSILLKNKWIEFSLNSKYINSALKFGLPLIPHAMSGSIITMTDRLFITNMVGLASTGVYTVGYQVGSIISILAGSFNIAFVPWLFEKLKKNEYHTKVKIVKFTYLYFFGIVFLATLLGIGSPFLLRVILGKEFNESGIYVIWIALGYAFDGMYLMVVNYIFYAQKTKFLAMLTFVTALFNLILNYFFIRKYGAIGAAQATTITFLIKFLIVWAFANKVQRMPWNLLKTRLIK